ncbi:lytic transglycosylase domain-containing protein [Asaia bogorensis]|uniref:lytic transglycosylase domain-containing protein n=1 Tax=Asaia bogorensis TaxID=91915 RepID=UPI00301B2C51
MRGAAFCRRGALAAARFGLALVLSPVPGEAQDLDALVREAARQAAIPPSWIRAVLRIESDGDRHAVSSAGAMGLMQIMPGTWRDLRRTLNLGADPFDPHDNITAGAAYLRWLHDRYGDVGFLAAYNAGPGRYDEHLATGRPLPDETRAYVASVVRRMGDDAVPTVLSQLSGTPSPLAPVAIAGLFAGPAHPVMSDTAEVGDSLAPPTPAGLFVPAGWRKEP